jgi:polar amino acid transport system substrate-binding protein
MRKWTLRLAVLSMLAAACAPQEYEPQTPAAQYQTAASCLQVTSRSPLVRRTSTSCSSRSRTCRCAKRASISARAFDVNQALVSVRGSAIADATSLEDVKDAVLGAQIGTTSLSYIEDNIQPTMEPAVFDDVGAAVQDLKNGRVDGIVVDLPTAFLITAMQIPRGVIVGQFPTAGSQEHFAMAFEKGSRLVECVNLALREMKDDGTLDETRHEWLADKADAPLIEG